MVAEAAACCCASAVGLHMVRTKKKILKIPKIPTIVDWTLVYEMLKYTAHEEQHMLSDLDVIFIAF